jgi:uncharacterized tellurite resistance protein B-like protein
LEDFIKNAIYFQLVSELNSRGITLSLSDQDIRKVCLAAGIMARVAWVDQSICEQEQDSISHALAIGWQLPEEHARLITEISHHRMMKGLDSARMTKGFCDCTTIPERKAFVNALFAIANAAHKTSHQEIEEIRTIAKALELSHQDFIEAKLTISKDDRGGL